ncbi:MAG: T9SS type A sorting domain-containing protein [Bacteroidia bacterium]
MQRISPLSDKSRILIFSSFFLQKKRTSGFVVSPNPNNGLISVEITNKDFVVKDEELRIKNVLGEVVKQEKLLSKKQQFDLSELKNGIYFLQVIQDEKVLCVKKIIKQ